MSAGVAPHPRRDIGGFAIADLSLDGFVEELDRAVVTRRQTLAFFANAHFVVKCQHLRDRMAAASALIVNDGIGMRLASLAIYRQGFLANLGGTDAVPAFLDRRAAGTRVFLLGCTPGDVRAAADVMAARHGACVVGVQDGFSFRGREAELIADINAAQPDVLMVGMGNPLQEEWILDNADRLQVPVIMSTGALFVWISGRQKRAPKFIQRLSMEWLYRLALEPRRLGDRYTLGLLRFAAICASHRVVQRYAEAAAGGFAATQITAEQQPGRG
jgi:beta-1,4-glucosyltransferase